MKFRQRGMRSGLLKALITVCLLAGVFAMHGLTSNHNVAMPVPLSAAPVSPDVTVVAHDHHAAVVADGHHVAAVAVADGKRGVEVVPAGHEHVMGDVCLAMLTLLALAIVALLAWRSLRVFHPAQMVPVATRRIAPGPAPPWLQPSLSKLCVLRT
ncbi:DUF6153 family protein [Kribbella deserti]|uniref:DUF6153 family protein n=1 Tax=Kribbella deserti TaxID=1926257 RepID=A0ABV6QRI5_9ACTN